MRVTLDDVRGPDPTDEDLARLKGKVMAYYQRQEDEVMQAFLALGKAELERFNRQASEALARLGRVF